MGRARPAETVGWVERSETHHLRHREGDGFRCALPILRTVKQILGVIARLRPGDPVFQRRSRLSRDASAILDAPHEAGHDIGGARSSIPAARSARVISITPDEEGAGNAGCRPHPWPACNKKSRRQLPQARPEQSGIPCAMVLTAASCSPWSAGLDSLHRLTDHHRKA